MAKMLRTPYWNELRSLGELRLLRVSYVLLAAIPLYQSLLRTIEPAYVYAQHQAHRAADASGTIAESDLGEARRSKSSTGSDPKGGSGQATISRDVSHLAIAWETKWLFVSMLAVSIANLLFSVWCPQTLRVHQNAPPPSAHGYRFDWCIRLYDAIWPVTSLAGRSQRSLLAQRLIKTKDEEILDLPGNTPESWVLSEWIRVQTSTPWLRRACYWLYLSGLLTSLLLLALKSVRVVTS